MFLSSERKETNQLMNVMFFCSVCTLRIQVDMKEQKNVLVRRICIHKLKIYCILPLFFLNVIYNNLFINVDQIKLHGVFWETDTGI